MNILNNKLIDDLISIIGPVESAEKIYDTTENGVKPNDFHKCCDGKVDTLVVIQAENGRIAGGYSDVAWVSTDEYKSSNNAFLFSIDNKRKYKIKNTQYAVVCGRLNYALFGGKIISQ